MVEFETERLELVFMMPPPPRFALVFEMVELDMAMVLALQLKLLSPPPKPDAEFPEMVELEMVNLVLLL